MKKLMILAGLMLGLMFVNGCVTTGGVYVDRPHYYRPHYYHPPVIFGHPHHYWAPNRFHR